MFSFILDQACTLQNEGIKLKSLAFFLEQKVGLICCRCPQVSKFTSWQDELILLFFKHIFYLFSFLKTIPIRFQIQLSNSRNLQWFNLLS